MYIFYIHKFSFKRESTQFQIDLENAYGLLADKAWLICSTALEGILIIIDEMQTL